MATKQLAQVIAERDNQVMQSVSQLDMNIIATWVEAVHERDAQKLELYQFIKGVQDGSRDINEIVVTDDGHRFKPVMVNPNNSAAQVKAKEGAKSG